MKITIQAIDLATQEQFDSMYTIGEIVRGDNIEMTLSETVDVVNDVLGTDATWQVG